MGKNTLLANSFGELVDQEVGVFNMRGCAQLLCGPISTGGRGSIETNLEVFAAAHYRLNRETEVSRSRTGPLYNQLVLEPTLWHLRDKWLVEHPDIRHENPIMTRFYIPFFGQVRFARVHFISRWETSLGSRRERAYFTDERSDDPQISDLSEGWIEIALAMWRADPVSVGYVAQLLDRSFADVPV